MIVKLGPVKFETVLISKILTNFRYHFEDLVELLTFEFSCAKIFHSLFQRRLPKFTQFKLKNRNTASSLPTIL